MPTIPIEVQRLMNKAKLTKGLPLQPKKKPKQFSFGFFYFVQGAIPYFFLFCWACCSCACFMAISIRSLNLLFFFSGRFLFSSICA